MTDTTSDTTYVAFDVWPEDGRHAYWTIDPYRPTYGVTVTFLDGTKHRYVNATHERNSGNGAATHQYHVGPGGALQIILNLIDFFEVGSTQRETYPKGSQSERVLRTYGPGTWALVEGECRINIDRVNPSVNLLDPKD